VHQSLYDIIEKINDGECVMDDKIKESLSLVAGIFAVFFVIYIYSVPFWYVAITHLPNLDDKNWTYGPAVAALIIMWMIGVLSIIFLGEDVKRIVASKFK